MKEMGWTYQELLETPAGIVDNIIQFLNTESKYLKYLQEQKAVNG